RTPASYPLLIRHPPSSTLFPYTTLFRSHRRHRRVLPPRRPRDRAALPEARGDDAALVPGRRRVSGTFRAPHPSVPCGAFHSPERSEEHTSELQSLTNLVCRLLLEKKNRL